MELLKDLEVYWTNRASGYSKVNRDELDGSQHENWKKWLSNEIKKVFPESMNSSLKILDVGTGPGFFAIILTEMGYSVTAIDYTEAMLDEAKKNAGDLVDKIDFYRMDAQNLDFPEESFDVVISRNITWNLDRPFDAYKSWHRVLKDGGLLLNFDANWYGHLFNEDLRKAYFEDRLKVSKSGVEDHYTCTDIDTMEDMALKMPLSPVNRPNWDERVLNEIGYSKVSYVCDMGKEVWSETERINYASTPMFMVKAIK